MADEELTPEEPEERQAHSLPAREVLNLIAGREPLPEASGAGDPADPDTDPPEVT